ncbi:MAG: hypothetical protein RRB13_01840 [bacterium]|nr:hypothetical protein [bacterium]
MKILLIQKTDALEPALQTLLEAHQAAGHQLTQIPLPPADGDFGPLLEAIEEADQLLTWELT